MGVGGLEEEDGNGGMRANKRRHLECCSCSGLPLDDTWSVNCFSYTHTRTHSTCEPAELKFLSGRLLTYICCSSCCVAKLCLVCGSVV